MDLANEQETEKTLTTLTNVEPESTQNYQLQFEQFIVTEKSDVESDEDEDEDQLLEEIAIEEQDDGTNVGKLLEDLENWSSSQQCTLKSNEIAIIESCHHKDLKNLLFLNRSKNYMLMQLFKKVKDLLIECRSDIESLKRLAEESERTDKCMYLTHLGAPYFKTKKEMFSCASNKDTLTKKKSGELSIYQNSMSPKWSTNECDNLTRAVKLNYNQNKQKTILRKITALRCKAEKEKCSSVASNIYQQIDALEEEIKELIRIAPDDVPPLGKNDYIDWDHIASEYLKNKHSSNECRSFWQIYVHPGHNKSDWSIEENEKIKALAAAFNYQDWDHIAFVLDTSRSGFSVYLHFVNVLSERISKMKFTKEEDDSILDHVERMRVGSFIPWNAIESCFPRRSRSQLVQRYKYALNVGESVAGKFSDAEDILILILIERFGNNYSKFPKYLPHRSYAQIKGRYGISLRLSAIKGGFTLEEDQTLMEYMSDSKMKKLGSLSLLMNRTRNQLRQRYKTIEIFFEKNPEATLTDVPRRAANNNEDERRYEFLKCMAEQFKYHPDVPTLEEIEMKLGIRKDMKGKHKKHENYNADALLANFFSSSYKLDKKPLETNTFKISEAAESIFDILSKWKVNLEIPDDLQKNENFDVVDVEILGLLQQKYDSQPRTDPSTAVEDLLPPNTNTLIGLRGLLLKNHLYKRSKLKPRSTLMDDLPPIRNKKDIKVSSQLVNMFKELPPHLRSQVENERCLFFERFISTFMWPSIFSIEPPNELLLEAEMGVKANLKSIPPKPNEAPINKKRLATIDEDETVDMDKPKPKRAKTIRIETAKKTPSETSKPTRCSTRLKNPTKKIGKEKKEIINNSKNLQNVTCPKVIKLLKNKKKEMETIQVASLNEKETTKHVKIIKIIKIDKPNQQQTITNEKEKQCNEDKISEVPQNLKKVDSTEIKNLLNGKKPVKIFTIQKIQMKDGTIKNVAKPYEGNNLPSMKNRPIETTQPVQPIKKLEKNKTKLKISKKIEQPKLLPELNILDMVSVADSVKQKLKLNSEVSNKIDESVDINLKKLKVLLQNNIKTHPKPKSEVSRTIKDLSKLNQFLSNVRENDDIIDLTRENMHNDVKLLDDLIKKETVM